MLILFFLTAALTPAVQAADRDPMGAKSEFKSGKFADAIAEETEAMKDIEREIEIKAAEEKLAAQISGKADQSDDAHWPGEPTEAISDDGMPNPSADQFPRGLKIRQTDSEAKKINPSVSQKEAYVPLISSFNDQTAGEMIDSLIPQDLLKEKIDLDFGRASLGDIFMTLGKAGHFNIMVDSTIKDLMVEIYLQQVTVKEALILIANAHNLGFKKVGSSLFAAPIEKLQNQSVDFKIIKLRNIKALDAKAFVAQLARVVNISEEANSLIVIGNPSEIEKVERAIQAIDHP